MRKLPLYVLDDDSSYADRLAQFIRASEFAEQLQVKLFSKPELLEEVLAEPRSEGILLLSESYYSLLSNRRPGLCAVILSENIATTREAEAMTPFLYRYQALQQLLTRLLAFYEEKGGSEPSLRKVGAGRTKVLSIYSSVGGSGKTVTAIHLAKQLAYRGSRVFYLSLESVSSASAFLQGDCSKFSQLLYYVKSSPELLGPRIEMLKSRDSGLGLDYMTPQDQIREMQELKGEEVRLCVEAIAALRQYDYILIDLEASVHPRVMKALELSDAIYWILLDDLHCLYKTKAYGKLIGSFERVHFILNKYTGSLANDWNDLGASPVTMLPYIPQWKTVRSSEQIWRASPFSEQVYDMFVKTNEERREYEYGPSSVVEGAEAS